MPKTYDRNTKDPKFYSTAVGREGYNPEVIMSYNSSNELLKVEEIWRGVNHSQTVSGSNYANHTISYTLAYSSWEETTVS
jgi:hypothetical protein